MAVMFRLFVVCVCLSAVAQPFRDGERAVLFGDSVTHHGYYTSQIQCFYYTRYPQANIRVWNCGVGGNTIDESLCRLEGDIFARNPTFVSVLLGANDVGVDAYRTNAPAWALTSRASRLPTFKRQLPELRDLLVKGCPKARFMWCTPVPWDDELKFRPARAPITGVTAAEREFADALTAFQRQVGGDYLDYFGPMFAYNTALHKKDPYASLSPDSIHPREPGGLFMARLFLKAQGVSGTVADVVLDAATGQTLNAENAVVSSCVKTVQGGLSFTLLEKALPFPVEPAARAIADEFDFDTDLNREMLTVKGLSAGTWVLKVDGSNVVVKTAAEWAAGVNLALCEATPMMQHARRVAALNAERVAQEKKIRSLWCARTVIWRRIRWGSGMTLADLDNPKILHAFLTGYFNALKDGRHGDRRMYEGFRENWRRRAQYEAEVEKLHNRIRMAAQPKVHLFVLERQP